MLAYPQVTHIIAGNTAGVLATISSGTYSLFGGSNITLSQNANSVSIIGASGGAAGGSTIQQFTPFAAPGVFVAVATAQARLSAFPFVLPAPASFCRLNLPFAFQLNGTASTSLQGGRINSWAYSKSIGLYSRGTGANSTRLESIFSASNSYSVIQSYIHSTDALSASATNALGMSFNSLINSTGGLTTSTFLTSSSVSSVGAIASVSLSTNTLTASFEAIPFNVSLPAGEYWLAVMISTGTTSSGVLRAVVNGADLMGGSYIPAAVPWKMVGGAANTSSAPLQFFGQYSVTSTALPVNIGSNEMSNVGNLIFPFAVFMNSALT